MLHTVRSFRGMVVAPHHLAAQAGLRVLEDGGNAVEAMIAAASTIAVVYPHMNALGGDNFWLIHSPVGKVVGIDACGAAASRADIDSYKEMGFQTIPSRGPLAALTVAGAVSGWQEAYDFSTREFGGRLSMSRILEDAAFLAQDGVAVTQTQAANTSAKLEELLDVPGFAPAFLINGNPPTTGDRFRQPALSETLKKLGEKGLDSFYRGDLAKVISAELDRAGSPISREDLKRHRAIRVKPLSVKVAGHRVFNMPPPTQGLASLIILGVFDQLGIPEAEDFNFVHGLVESTKRAFRIRDRYVTDPQYMDVDPASFLSAEVLENLASEISADKALPWPEEAAPGDTVWLGAIDSEGRAVSFIQSIYWEFGSGLVLPETGITWQNRGVSFSLEPGHTNSLAPFRRPFHTIQPALAHLNDGRVMCYGTMGGEGQPQTQAMVFTRHVLYGQELQQAVTAPRWLLGRTWGATATNLRMESRFAPEVYEALKIAGHDVEILGPFDEVMGHAGAVVRHPDDLLEGAADPRGNGQPAGY
jgi:gamma-glutamyltranspeptidase/glutathione hydrolase